MGRKPKSLAELELSGALKARPARYKGRLEAAKAPAIPEQKTIIAPAPNKPAPLGSAPKHLSADEKAIWKELTKTYPNLIFSDRFHLEIATKLTHKLRTAEGGLKGQEYSQLLGILDRFAPELGFVKNDKADPEPIPVTPVAAPDVDRTPEEEAWDEFDELFGDKTEKPIRAEMARREQTNPPDHLTETEKKYWAGYLAVKRDLFPDEYTDTDRQCQRHIEWRDNQIALGLSTEYVDPKFRKVEPEKVEYNLLPPAPRPEPFEMDPARKREQMERKWSM